MKHDCKNNTFGDVTKCLNCMTESEGSASLPADKQVALDVLINETCQEDTKFLRLKIIDHSDYRAEGCEHLENMCVLINKQRAALKEFRKALTAPQPMADLEGLKKRIEGMPFRIELMGGQKHKYLDRAEVIAWIDDATGRLNTAQQAEEIKALKAAVRDLDGIVTRYMKESFDGHRHYAQEKHYDTIAKVRGV